jgi:succinate dehydrogenase / fumarate reductase flavoprotein subunit
MNDLVGIIRKADEIERALDKLDEIKQRILRVTVEGHRQFNPGWHLAVDLRNMLLVSECVAQAALRRTESRGGHTRDDHPGMDAQWRNKLLVCRASGGENPVVPEVTITVKPQEPIRQDLLELFDLAEVEKYYTEDELAGHPGRQA